MENKRRLKGAMKAGEKIVQIKLDTYGRKGYFSLTTPSPTREIFATRLTMQPLAGNFSIERQLAKTGWLLRCGSLLELKEHVVTTCPMYRDLREMHGNLGEVSNLAKFFREA